MSDTKKTGSQDPVEQQNQGPVGQNQNPGGSTQNPVDEGKQTVSYETYQKAVDESKAAKKRLKEYEDSEATKKAEKLKEEGKFKELYEKEQSENTKKNERLKLQELKLKAKEAGMEDTDYCELLMKKAEFNDDLELTNGETLFKDLKEKKPYLFGQAEQTLSTDKTKTNIYKPGQHIFTVPEISKMSKAEFEANYAEIKRQERAGLIK